MNLRHPVRTFDEKRDTHILWRGFLFFASLSLSPSLSRFLIHFLLTFVLLSLHLDFYYFYAHSMKRNMCESLFLSISISHSLSLVCVCVCVCARARARESVSLSTLIYLSFSLSFSSLSFSLYFGLSLPLPLSSYPSHRQSQKTYGGNTRLDHLDCESWCPLYFHFSDGTRRDSQTSAF